MSRLSRPLYAAVLISLAASPARGADAGGGDLRALFPSRAPVHAGAAGAPVRLPITAEILSSSQPDLSDVRLVDEDGREIPYAIDAGPRPPRETVAVERLDVVVEDVRREELADPGAPEEAPHRFRETYRIRLPEDASPDGEVGDWSLVLTVPSRSFLANVRVERDGGDVVREATVFRLDNVARDKRRVPLPGIRPGAVLRVAIESHGRFLAPVLHVERTRELPGAGRASVVLAEVDRRHEDGATILELARPEGLVPDLLRLETTTPLFDRAVEVWDAGTPATEARLGTERVFRVRGASEDLEIDLVPARGDRLRVRILDGDSPPLDDLVVRAEVREPALVFAAPARPAFLYFGGGRTERPRYDLAHLLPAPDVALGEARASAWLALSERNARRAELGTVEPNPFFRDEPVLAFAMRAAAKADVRAFRWSRDVVIPATREGLARIRLGADDLARLRPDLGDVRVVDASDRQWPFLLSRGASPQTVELPSRAPEREDGRSRYALELPATPAVLDRVIVDSDAAFFDREYRLVGASVLDDRGESTLASGRLVRAGGDPRPLTIDFPAMRVESLRLEVEDGDEAPLPLTVQARLPLADLLVVAPAGDYRLLLGHPDVAAPRYEIARVRDVVLSVEAVEADAGALAENPAFSRTARLATEKGRTQVALWIALLLAVAGLGVLTFRLARGEENAAGGEGPKPGPPA